MKRGSTRKFSREFVQREALFKALATALIDHEKIRTTKAKAKTLASHMDRLITTAKKNTLASRRALLIVLGPKAVSRLMNTVLPKLSGRSGGYTRVVSLGQRPSDGAEMALVELLTG